jgi:hypothetical protein
MESAFSTGVLSFVLSFLDFALASGLEAVAVVSLPVAGAGVVELVGVWVVGVWAVGVWAGGAAGVVAAGCWANASVAETVRRVAKVRVRMGESPGEPAASTVPAQLSLLL